MLNDKKIIVVIPAYNVQDQIRHTIEGIKSFVDVVIVVDDCSQDNTASIVTEISDPRVILIRSERNEGVGGATVKGLRTGLELGGDIFVKIDGDHQMDTDKLEDLIAPLYRGYDYAKANRFLDTGALRQMPLIRLAGNFILTFATKLVSGYWDIFDPQNGYIAVSKQPLSALPLDDLNKRYFFENDLLIGLNSLKAKVCDVSIPARYGPEHSSLRIWRVLFGFPGLLLARFIRRIYTKYILVDFSVIGLFYIMGLFLMAFGTFFGIYHWFMSFYTGIVATTGTVMIAVLPIILGFQLFLHAMVLEIEENKRRNRPSGDKGPRSG
jgi:dolichol-phosphate mannosyltransferase